MIFNLFKKKKEENNFSKEKFNNQSDELKALIAKWDNYLENKIKTPFLEMIKEANQGSEQMIEQLKDDLGPLIQAWSAIEVKMNQFSSRLDNSWGKVYDKFSEIEDFNDEIMDVQSAKLDEIHDWLKIEYERARVNVLAQASSKLMGKAEELSKEDFSCSQCSANLGI